MRVVIAGDNSLTRAGIAALVGLAGIDIVAEAASPEELLREVEAHAPDVAIVDIRMPPTFTDEGVRAAHEIRTRHPHIAIVILSQHVDLGTAMRVLTANPEGLGYLLKDRVTDVDDFVGTLHRVAAGGSALDPEVVSRLLAHAHELQPLAARLRAPGRSARGCAFRNPRNPRRLHIGPSGRLGRSSGPRNRSTQEPCRR